jgi:hypothetical protein
MVGGRLAAFLWETGVRERPFTNITPLPEYTGLSFVNGRVSVRQHKTYFTKLDLRFEIVERANQGTA